MGHFKNAAKGRLNWVFSIIAVVAIAVFLRIYNFPSGFSFEGELGRELIYLKSLVDAGRLPTIGLTTSHEWLSYGPFYYWIMMPFYKLAGGHPFVLFWTGIAAVSAGLLANYLVVRRIAGEKLATVSSLVTALSPVLIWQTMNAKLHLFFFILIPIFMYFLHLLWQGKKKWVFW
ncbi:MAG TPA: glycosyltransferase family 39 protein, partial [Patescibacteria group bacterium]|nr:glycosyltransferase family 39 protein [Patescibacteria group bacterium]